MFSQIIQIVDLTKTFSLKCVTGIFVNKTRQCQLMFSIIIFKTTIKKFLFSHLNSLFQEDQQISDLSTLLFNLLSNICHAVTKMNKTKTKYKTTFEIGFRHLMRPIIRSEIFSKTSEFSFIIHLLKNWSNLFLCHNFDLSTPFFD